MPVKLVPMFQNINGVASTNTDRFGFQEKAKWCEVCSK